MAVKRVAVIGAGPAGAIAIDALAQEKAFDVIRVFERQSMAGGNWVGDPNPAPPLTEFSALASRTADQPLVPPPTLPTQTPKVAQPRYDDCGIYPYLETNIDYRTMEFSQERIPDKKSPLSIWRHGPDTPFRHWSVIQRFIQSLVDRSGYQDLVEYNTTVEKVEKVGGEWKVTLRRSGTKTDTWWVECFDAVVVASGHCWVPYIPETQGLEEFAKRRPGSVIHSKGYRGKDNYRDKRVVVVGASVSAADIAFDLAGTASAPVEAVTIGHPYNGYFGGEAFNHPLISNRPTIARVDADTRSVHFVDGTSVDCVDHIIFATGFSWTTPFLPQVAVRNNRVPGLYQHVVWREDPTLLFVGAIGAGLTFKAFEWQAVYAARLLAGRGTLPPLEERDRWEQDRIKVKGDGPKFPFLVPGFEEYFETLRRLAGPPRDGKGRELPPFKKEWAQLFFAGHEMRKQMWRRLNDEAKQRLGTSPNQPVRAKL